jgi:inner membrane protein
MLLFAHAGLTLGAAALAARAVKNKCPVAAGVMSWFDRVAEFIDIRVLLVGALLPDIIDKPVGEFFFRDTFGNGRIFFHTLVFLILVVSLGLYLFRRWRQVWMLTLAGGALMHLVLDAMWTSPATLFWPFLGFIFEKEPAGNWLSGIWYGLLTQPGVYVPEIAGFLILLWLGLSLLARKKLWAFIWHGRVN